MSDVAIPAAKLPTQADLWDELEASADVVESARLIGKDKKTTLVGMPLMVVGLAFRDGVRKDKNTVNTYVSVEAIVGSRAKLDKAHRQGLITVEQLNDFDPLERIVWNDGSTGIRRQAVSYCESKGLIRLPDGPVGGAAGESRFDTYWRQWQLLRNEDLIDNTDEDVKSVEFPVILKLAHGLRASTYESDYNPEGGLTYYW